MATETSKPTMPPYKDTIVDYWLVHIWGEDAIRKGLHHDFVVLGREVVRLHYHTKNQDCNEKCETRINPEYKKEAENE